MVAASSIRLDEVVEAIDRARAGGGFFADESPDLGEATQVGVDAEMVGHPGRVSRWVEGGLRSDRSRMHMRAEAPNVGRRRTTNGRLQWS